jgi:branched-chain amino acid transport system permease protein
MIEMVKTYFRRAYLSFLAHVVDIPPRLLAFLLILLWALVPVFKPDGFTMMILVSTNIWAIFVASWDLLVGFTGQMSLGHALFYGIGGYSTALLFKYFRLPTWITIPLSLVVVFSVAIMLSYPALRVRGPYLAMTTMAFALIASSVLYIFPKITGADSGISKVPLLFPLKLFRREGVTPLESVYQQTLAYYYLTFISLVITLLVLYKITHSKTGIVLISVLDDELASKASGINVNKFKVMAFAISALFAGYAGCLQVHFIALADPGLFALTTSFLPVIVTILGGIGTIYGPVIGIFVYQILNEIFFRKVIKIPLEIYQAKLLIFIVVILILVIKWPRGIGKFITDKLKDLEEARDIDERGPRIWKTYKKKGKKIGAIARVRARLKKVA